MAGYGTKGPVSHVDPRGPCARAQTTMRVSALIALLAALLALAVAVSAVSASAVPLALGSSTRAERTAPLATGRG